MAVGRRSEDLRRTLKPKPLNPDSGFGAARSSDFGMKNAGERSCVSGFVGGESVSYLGSYKI